MTFHKVKAVDMIGSILEIVRILRKKKKKLLGAARYKHGGILIHKDFVTMME